MCFIWWETALLISLTLRDAKWLNTIALFKITKKTTQKTPEMLLNMLFIIKRNPPLQQPNKFNGNLFTDLRELY